MVAIKEVLQNPSSPPPLQIIKEGSVPQISTLPELRHPFTEEPLEVTLSTEDTLKNLIHVLGTTEVNWAELEKSQRKKYLTGAINLLNHDFGDFRGNLMEKHLEMIIRNEALKSSERRIQLKPLRDLVKKNRKLPGTTFITKKNGSVYSINEESHNMEHEIDHLVGIKNQGNKSPNDNLGIRLVVFESKGIEQHRKRVYNGTTSMGATLQDAISSKYMNDKFELLLAYAQEAPEIASFSYVVVTYSDMLDDNKTSQKRFRDEYNGILVGIPSTSVDFSTNALRIFDSIRADTKTFRKIGGYKNMSGPDLKHPHIPYNKPFRKLYVNTL